MFLFLSGRRDGAFRVIPVTSASGLLVSRSLRLALSSYKNKLFAMPWQLASAFEILQKPDDFFNIKNTLCLSDIIHSSIIVRLDIICSQHQRLCTLKGRVNATIQARNFQTLAVSDIIISSSCQIVSAAIVPSYYEGFPKLCHQQKLYYDYLKTNTKASPKKKKNVSGQPITDDLQGFLPQFGG